MGKIVSVHSFRGGTGKTNITANVATVLAAGGNRVGIVDTDIQSPGIHVLFGVDEESMGRTLNDYLWGRCRIAEAALDVGATLDAGPFPAGQLLLVPSSIKAAEIARILREGYDVGMLNEGYQEAIKELNLDYLFIDTHPGLNEETLLSIAVSDVLLLIMRPDQQDYQGTAVTVEVARKLSVPALKIVVNKVLESIDPASLSDQVSSSYASDVAAVLPLSEDIIRLASGGVFSLRCPEHPWSEKIRSIAQQVAG